MSVDLDFFVKEVSLAIEVHGIPDDVGEIQSILDIMEKLRFSWEAIMDDRTCPICIERSALPPFTIHDELPMLPAHPNCRCTWRVLV